MSQTQTSAVPPLEHALEEGWTLPASWYADAGVAELERARLFARTWTYAGPAEWVNEPGTYFAAQIGHVPTAVVRGSDGGPTDWPTIDASISTTRPSSSASPIARVGSR